MNNFFQDYGSLLFESPEERLAKKIRLKKLFSRVFLALFIYTVVWQCLSGGIYIVASLMMSKEAFDAFQNNYTVAILISSGVQYVIALPIFMLSLIGTEKARPIEKTKLSFKDMFLYLMVGEALMFVGNLIGTMLNRFVGLFSGQTPENSIDSMINEIPMYVIFIFVVVVAPIVEELVFRKLMIDRLSIYGDRMAILFTAVAFGLIHANLYQFFYATMLGVLLGFVYAKTRDVKYTIILHMIINFLGSIVVLPVQDASIEYARLTELAANGEAYDLIALLTNGFITLLYTNMQYGMLIGGAIVLWNFIKNRKFRLDREKDVHLTDIEVATSGVRTVGSILFLCVSLILMFLSLTA